MLKKVNKVAIILVLLCLSMSFVLTACDSSKAFKPEISIPAKATVENNGGVAVKYGDYIYYVNGYQSSTDAANTYVNEIRVGEIVCVKVSDLENLIELGTRTSDDSVDIAEETRKVAKVVVPNYYYSGNTTSTELNGIYIFNDRLFVLTPNDKLTAGGAKLTSQLSLNSYALDGSDKKTHFVFTDNSTQILFSQNGENVYATYVVGSALNVLDVLNGTTTQINESISNLKIDYAGNGVFYNNEDGSICHYVAGNDEVVLVENKDTKGHEGHSHVTKTIAQVNNGYVYYTKTNSDEGTDSSLYYIKEGGEEKVLVNNVPSSYFCYENNIVVVDSKEIESKTCYSIYVNSDVNGDASSRKYILDWYQNDQSITINSLRGNILTYTANSITYTIDLTSLTEVAHGTAIAKSLSTTATGWSVPEVLDSYTFTLASGSVSVVKFDSEKLTNTASVAITLVEASDK